MLSILVLILFVLLIALTPLRFLIVPMWRWFSGANMFGEYYTNAGWFIRGDEVSHPRGRAIRWHYLPRIHRAGYRTGGTVLTVVICYGLWVAYVLTLACVCVAVAAVIGFTAWLVKRTWRHHRTWVRPLHRALAPAVGHPHSHPPKAWLQVPRNPAADKTIVWLPDHFTGSAESRGQVKQIVAAKLALEDPAVEFKMTGRPCAVFTPAQPPPDKVAWAEVEAIAAKLPPVQLLLGLGCKRAPVICDLDNDSPHLLFSMASGAGKSVATRTIAAQVLHNGGVCLILDIKRISHTWARGIPGVWYCRDIEEIHNALLWLEGEIDGRNLIVDDATDIDGTMTGNLGPRIFVLAEEMNATVARLRAYWRTVKAKGDPTESPAVEAFGAAMFMGRAIEINVGAVAQMFSARTAGGPEARENFGTRILGRYTANNWRMLVPEIWPMPRKSNKPGRVQACSGGIAQETQIAFMAPQEAHDYALSGKQATFPVMGHPVGAPEIAVLPGIGLAEACATGILSITLDAARQARKRDPDWPPFVGKEGVELLYDPDTLRRWEANRPRASGVNSRLTSTEGERDARQAPAGSTAEAEH